jgi:hypothetical protein
VPELRHGREYRAARTAYDVFIIRWDIWINNGLRGTARKGEFFGHGISQSPLIHAARLAAVRQVRETAPTLGSWGGGRSRLPCGRVVSL